MNAGETGRGMKMAYLSVFKLMNMFEEDNVDGVHWDNKSCKFVKDVNILSIK